jgi:hypothetical protein
MGFEIETFGDPVWRALTAMVAADDIRPLLAILDAAQDGWMRDAIWRQVATPDVLYRQMDRESVDLDVVERLVTRMGLSAAPALLDAPETADERDAAAYVEMIVRMGPDVAGIVGARADGARAPQLRVLISILTKLGVTPPGFDVASYTRHPDAAVRREAFRALIRDGASRDEMIATALGDNDERIVRMALGAAMTNCPAAAAQALIARAGDTTLSADLRALGIRAAASHKSPETLAFLISATTTKRRFLRRSALAAPTPEMLAALGGLATHWSREAGAVEILEMAAKSNDREIRDTVARRSGT